jgi:hypothetical protein
MAIDTIISGEDLVVVGPPASISVSVDIGPQGDRGAIFYSGVGAPSKNAELLINAQLGDLYINSELGGNYGVVYKLTATPGGSIWQSILKFQPISYSSQELVSFTAGSGSISVPISGPDGFYTNAPANLSADTILVQATAELANPAFISISNKTITDVDNVKTFVAELKGAQLSSGSVSLLSGSATPINIYITAGSEV